MNKTLQLSLATACCVLAGAAHAQAAGDWLVRVGTLKVTPMVTSGDLSAPSFAGSQVGVGPSTVLAGGVTYMLDNHISFDLPLSTPLKHDITGAGSVAGVGKLGDTQALPMTVLAQYRFDEPTSQLRPYVGLGPTYAVFYKEHGTNTLTALSGGTPGAPTGLSIKNQFGFTAQVGASLALNNRWSLDAALTKTWLKTRATLSSGQGLDLRLDPRGVTVNVGYRF